MDFDFNVSAADRASLEMQVNAFNKSLSTGGTNGSELGKDDFLKILITQLQHQDPTKPMEDREFIAQMAQFSTLEQMTNMSQEFASLTAKLSSSRALGMLGKTVEIVVGDQVVSGSVEAVTGGDFPQLLVNGVYYDIDDIARVTK